LTELLRRHPDVNGSKFEDLAASEGIGRNRARDFLSEGALAGSIDIRTGSKNAKKFTLKEAK